MPLYAARLEHLIYADTIAVECLDCEHQTAVPMAKVRELLPDRYRVVTELWRMLRCENCGARARVTVDAGAALGYRAAEQRPHPDEIGRASPICHRRRIEYVVRSADPEGTMSFESVSDTELRTRIDRVQQLSDWLHERHERRAAVVKLLAGMRAELNRRAFHIGAGGEG